MSIESTNSGFASEITTEAETTCMEIEAETEKLVSDALAKADAIAQNDGDAYYSDQEKVITQKLSASLSSKLNEQNKMILKRRDEICKDVFKQAAEKIFHFTESNEYFDFVCNSVNNAAKYFSATNLTVFLKLSDEDIAKELKNKYPTIEVKFDRTIKMGGAKITDAAASCFVNDTIDARFEEQKEQFAITSWLIIKQ